MELLFFNEIAEKSFLDPSDANIAKPDSVIPHPAPDSKSTQNSDQFRCSQNFPDIPEGCFANDRQRSLAIVLYYGYIHKLPPNGKMAPKWPSSGPTENHGLHIPRYRFLVLMLLHSELYVER